MINLYQLFYNINIKSLRHELIKPFLFMTYFYQETNRDYTSTTIQFSLAYLFKEAFNFYVQKYVQNYFEKKDYNILRLAHKQNMNITYLRSGITLCFSLFLSSNVNVKLIDMCDIINFVLVIFYIVFLIELTYLQ